MPRRSWSAPALLASVALLAASPAPAPQPSAGDASGLEMNGYRIETQKTNWNLNTGDFTMPVAVTVFRPGTDARGDHATGNTKQGTATLEGHVVVHDSGHAPEASAAGADYQGPATLTCDTLLINSKAKTYDARGNVRFVQGDRYATADQGVLDDINHTLHLEGNVLVSQGGSSMRANVVDYNLQTRDVVASGAPMVIRQPVPPPTARPAPSPRPSAHH